VLILFEGGMSLDIRRMSPKGVAKKPTAVAKGPVGKTPARRNVVTRGPARESQNAVAQKPAVEEDDGSVYWRQYLPGSQHIQSHHLAEEKKEDARKKQLKSLFLLLMNIMVVGAAVYIFKFSKLPFLVGMRRRFKI
ncbi:hypothetical protein ACFL2T_07050, partial [Elusimicrobiota bacterium]